MFYLIVSAQFQNSFPLKGLNASFPVTLYAKMSMSNLRMNEILEDFEKSSKVTRAFLLQENMRTKYFKSRIKRQYQPDKGFKGTVVNMALSSLHITLSVLLIPPRALPPLAGGHIHKPRRME